MLGPRSWWAVLLTLWIVTVSCKDSAKPAPDPGAIAGDVLEVTGDVKLVRNGTARALGVGDEVAANDEVVTGSDGDVVIELRHNHVRWHLGPEQTRAPKDAAAWSAPPPSASAVSGERTAVAGRHAEREAALTAAGAIDTQPGYEDPGEPAEPKGGSTTKPTKKKDDKKSAEKSDPDVQPTTTSSNGCDEVSCLLDDSAPCCRSYKKSSGGGGGSGSGSGSVSTDSEVQETLDRDQISEAIAKAKGALLSCGESFPDAPDQVKVKIRVSSSGTVSSIDAVDETDAAVVGCIASAIKKTRFPSTRKGGSFTFPAILR